MMLPIMSGPEFWSTSSNIVEQHQPQPLQQQQSQWSTNTVDHMGPKSLGLTSESLGMLLSQHCTSSQSSIASTSSAYSTSSTSSSSISFSNCTLVSGPQSPTSGKTGSSIVTSVLNDSVALERRQSKPTKRSDQHHRKHSKSKRLKKSDHHHDDDDDDYVDEDVDDVEDNVEDYVGCEDDGFLHPHQFQQRHAANLRERRRMQSINDAFEGLRERIPTLPYEKRLSKVDTLRLAIGYINFLGELVRTGASSLNPNGTNSFTSPRYCCPPPPKKVLVKSHLVGPNGTDLDSTHSLSWESDENRRPGAVRHSNHTLVAKVWTPEDPREPNAELLLLASTGGATIASTALTNSDQNVSTIGQSHTFQQQQQHVSTY